jgi:hypothetical protein
MIHETLMKIKSGGSSRSLTLVWMSIFVVSLTLRTQAAEDTWTLNGTTGTVPWTTGADWSAGAPPAPGDDAIIDGTQTISLGSTSETVNSLTYDAADMLGATAAVTLTDTTGNITLAGGRNYINSPISFVLGANGLWTGAASSDSLIISANISDGGNGYSLTTGGLSVIQLLGNNTFSGGLDVNNYYTYLMSDTAQGTGAITFTGAEASNLEVTAPTISNEITYNNVSSQKSVIMYAGGVQTWQTTFSAIDGNANNQTLAYDANLGTMTFSQGIQTTNINILNLEATLPTTGTSYATYIFNAANADATDAVELGDTSAPTATSYTEGTNLLLNGNITFANPIDTESATTSRTGFDTLGGIQSSGLATFSGLIIDYYDASTNNPQLNLVTLNAGATTDFSNEIYQDHTTVSDAVEINEPYYTANAATAGSTTTTYSVNNPVGTVELTVAGGNNYNGGTTVWAGALLVGNTSGSATGTGAVTVNSGATLEGNGIIAPTGGTNNININGTLSPGTAAAPAPIHFTLASGEQLVFGLNSTLALNLGASSATSSSVAFTAAGNWLSGSGDATLSLTLGTGFSYSNTYQIITNVTTSGFTFADITGYDSTDYTASVTQVGNAYDLSFTMDVDSVPEPKSWAMLAGGLVFLLALLRRRGTWRCS